MTLKESPQARLLLRLMRDLSEEYWCAQWLVGCEYGLWADLTGKVVNGNKPWGISEEEKEELRVLHELADGWFVWSEELRDQKFLTTDEWLAHLARISDSLSK